MADIDEVVHLTKDQWHHPIMTRHGWKPEVASAKGIVRSYKYGHPDHDFLITVTTGVHADHWSAKDSHGYWATLEPYVKGIDDA